MGGDRCAAYALTLPEPASPESPAAEGVALRQAPWQPAPKLPVAWRSRTPPAKRLPIPSEEAQAAAEKEIRQVHQAAFAKVDRAARIELARKLWKLTAETKDRPAAVFVLYRLAADLASAAGAAALSGDILHSCCDRFDPDDLTTLHGVFQRAAGALAKPWTGRDRKNLTQEWRNANLELADWALGACDDAIDAVNLELAEKLWQIARTAAARSSNASTTSLSRRIRTEKDALGNVAERQARATAAHQQLADGQDNSAAQSLFGRLLCVEQGRWSEGLRLLAAGSDPTWNKLAAQELSGEGDRVALGDAWWDLAETMTGSARAALRWRACLAYGAARSSLAGLTRAKVEQRLAWAAAPPDLSKLKPDHDEDFSRQSARKWRNEQFGVDFEVKDGVYSMRRGFSWFVGTHREANYPCGVVCRLLGRVTGPVSDGLTLTIIDADWMQDVWLRLDSDAHLRVRLPWDPARTAARPEVVVQHPTIKGHNEFNDLLIVYQGRTLEVYVNGILVHEPFTLDRNLAAFRRLRLGITARSSGVQVEIRRFTAWPADNVPSLEERTLAARAP